MRGRKAQFERRANSRVQHPRHRFDRLQALSIGVFLFSVVLVYRLFHIQILSHDVYAQLAEDQHTLLQELKPRRGRIYATEFRSDAYYPLVTNQEQFLLYAIPKAIKNPQETLNKILSVVDVDQEEILARLSKPNDAYEPIRSRVTEEEKIKLEALKIEGVGFLSEEWRTYPMHEFAAHISGFVGYDGDRKVGRYGLEQYFENDLAGKPGSIQAKNDAQGRLITVGETLIEKAQNGNDLILTIDHTIQDIACEELQKTVEKFGAEKGTVIVMDPKTGAIKAMCNMPSYDPNEYNNVKDASVFVNDAVTDQYEPGSVFKAITMAAGLDLHKVTPKTTYTDTGEVKVAGYTVHNSDEKAHGVVDMITVLVRSLNTGSIFVTQQIGNEALDDYVKKFGFGEKAGVELSGEQAGKIGSLATNKDVYAWPASYGQGITVTPLQLITAYSAIINGGKLMKPFIVDRVVNTNGFEVKTEPRVVRQVISEQTSLTLSAMLVNVLQSENGHTKRARIPGYRTGGKTGTAQVPGSDGKYDENLHKDTFLEFGPASDPKFIVLGKIDKPHGVRFADSSTAPMVAEILKNILTAYEVPHDQE